ESLRSRLGRTVRDAVPDQGASADRATARSSADGRGSPNAPRPLGTTLVTTPVGVGDLVAWDGGVLLIGRANRVIPTHAHQAIQVAFGYAGPVGLRTTDDEDWTAYPLGIVASRQPHSMDATAATYNAVIFVEPETALGRSL